jgi:hypothetical protein
VAFGYCISYAWVYLCRWGSLAPTFLFDNKLCINVWKKARTPAEYQNNPVGVNLYENAEVKPGSSRRILRFTVQNPFILTWGVGEVHSTSDTDEPFTRRRVSIDIQTCHSAIVAKGIRGCLDRELKVTVKGEEQKLTVTLTMARSNCSHGRGALSLIINCDTYRSCPHQQQPQVVQFHPI